MGLIKDTFDARDHYYTADPATKPASKVDLRQHEGQSTLGIYDQLETGTCTANATAAAYWYEEKVGRREQVWGQAGPSRLFIYWLARGAYQNHNYSMPWPADAGCAVRDAMKSLAKCGACSEEEWPFDVAQINKKPPPEAFTQAEPHKINSFYRLDPQRPYDDSTKLTTEQYDQIGAVVLDNVKKCLTEQYPVVFGFWYLLPPPESFDQTQQPFVLKDVWAFPDKHYPRHTPSEHMPTELRFKNAAGNFSSPGHTVLAIGYDDEKEAVLIQNSLGPTWGGDGTFWMPYSWITDCGATNDFWTIRCTTSATDSPPKKWDEVHQEVLGVPAPVNAVS